MIFFDIDGTLIDHKRAESLGVKGFYSEYKSFFSMSEALFYETWCRISEKHFLRFLKGEITFEQQRTERIKDVFLMSGIRLSDEEANIKFKVYRKNYEENLRPYEDAISCLKALSDYRLGIISNGDLNQQMFKIKRISERNLFDIVITAGETGFAKPDAQIFRIACDMAGTDIKDCCYVGDDYRTDIEPCINLGMKGIWLNRNSQQPDIPGVVTINKLTELPDLVNSMGV